MARLDTGHFEPGTTPVIVLHSQMCLLIEETFSSGIVIIVDEVPLFSKSQDENSECPWTINSFPFFKFQSISHNKSLETI